MWREGQFRDSGAPAGGSMWGDQLRDSGTRRYMWGVNSGAPGDPAGGYVWRDQFRDSGAPAGGYVGG